MNNENNNTVTLADQKARLAEQLAEIENQIQQEADQKIQTLETAALALVFKLVQAESMQVTDTMKKVLAAVIDEPKTEVEIKDSGDIQRLSVSSYIGNGLLVKQGEQFKITEYGKQIHQQETQQA